MSRRLRRNHSPAFKANVGFAAINRRPNASKPAPSHKIYPYLLHKLPITRPNQIWAIDITYTPMARSFVYLAAVVDWFRRGLMRCHQSR